MMTNPIKSLSMAKYERMLPRIFPGASLMELQELEGKAVWRVGDKPDAAVGPDDGTWADIGHRIERRDAGDNRSVFRRVLMSRDHGAIGRLVVAFDTQSSVPLMTAQDALRRAFGDAALLLQEEIDLQAECDQLAVELTERYEELNLVYDTKDEVEYLEEGQEALVTLVHNCADYLNVGLAALVCRDQKLALHADNGSARLADVPAIMELLSSTVYDGVEARLNAVIINESHDEERQRLFGGRRENLLAHPIVDDYGNVIGLIAVASARPNHHFSNGDRNLLEVMCKKASRIIHTHHDSLTGLMNRSGFETALVSAISSVRQSMQQYCLLQIDIDQLHTVNDLMGHQEGDNVIRRVSRILKETLRETDQVARLGADEFAVLLPNCTIDQGQTVAENLSRAISELKCISADRQLDVTVSIGVAAVNPDCDGIVSVMASAEIACTAAKEGGRNRIEIFADDNTDLIRRSEEIEWISRLQKAIRDDQFILFCQPVLAVDEKNHPPHYEILVRLKDGDKILSPAAFIPAAERYQLMPQIDRWIVSDALKRIEKEWAMIESAGAVFCINLSGQSLTNPGFFAFLNDELERCGVPNRNICFEITETAAIANVDEATTLITAMRELGCRFALDDFGAGLSSFGYLKTLPVDYLKIDGSFVLELTSDDVSRAMVESISHIAKTMGLTTIAEFVCDAETVAILEGLGIDYLQGYHIGKPMALADMMHRLREDVALASA